MTATACRRFPVDAVTARLVRTCRGSGTHHGLAPGGGDPARIVRVPTGAPIPLRGTLWPEHRRTGRLHPSPPIEGTGAARLVLVPDPPHGPEEEA